MRTHYRNAAVEILPKLSGASSPLHIINEALSEHKKKKYDFIWCIYDCDVLISNKPADFDIQYEKALKAGILFADSFPCFEIWLLAHYELPSLNMTNSNDVLNALCKKIDGYCKHISWHSKNDLFAMLLPQLNDAIKNAKKLEEKKLRENTPAFTNIYLLIESIIHSLPILCKSSSAIL